MDLSRPFIERPIATALLTVALLLAGLLALRLLPVAALPQVEYPVIQVTTFQPGASPDIMARTVTAPLERHLGQVPGLQRLSSASGAGVSTVTLQFALSVNLGVAEQEVQAALTSAAALLPSDLPAPPVYRKVNPGEAPVITLAVTSATLPMPQVHDLADTRMAQKLAQLPGVGLVSLAGGQRPAVRVQADPGKLAAHGLVMEDVRKAVAAANVNQAKGSFDGPVRMTMLDANDQVRSVEDYRALVLSYKDGAPLRLGDVATITDGAEDRFRAAWRDDMPAVIVNVQHQPGANVVEVADRVHALLPRLQATLPAAVDVAVLGDRTDSIRASVRDVQIELVIAMALVVGVTLAFLHSPKAALVPSIAVPLSIVGTFAFMHLAGYSLNNLSLMALTIATGFVVDDAIVMVENIARHREQGASPMQAALAGAREIGFTLVSLTVSLIAVLIPLLFMADVAGRMFHEFAMTLAVAIVISLAVSLTLTPMMSARLLDAGPAHARGPLDRVVAGYARGLDWTLAHQRLVLLALLGVVALTVALYAAVAKGFFPVQDGGLIQGVTQAPPHTSYAAMADRQRAIARAVGEHPDVASLSSFIGVDGVNTTLNSGRLLINLTPHGDRSRSAQQVAAELTARVAGVPGVTAWFQPVQSLSIDDTVSRTPYRYTLTAPDAALLARWAPRLVERLQADPRFVGVAHDLEEGGRQAWIAVDRDAAARLGASVADIATALQNAFGQRQVATLHTQTNQYRVVLEADPTLAEAGLDAVRAVRVPLPDGRSTPLVSVASVTERSAPLLVRREGQFPAATVSFDLAPGASLGDAVPAVVQAFAALDAPASIEGRFVGTAEAFRASLADTLWLMLAAVVVMYLVLGMLYESTVHPLTILSTLPSAVVGALLALMIAGRPLDLIAVIGLVLLIGLVKKNGIMMVDFALDAQRRLGLSPQDAIRRAALLRFRPILMTTLAALFGALPLMFSGGSGAELRQPLGLVMVGGLVTSQVLTLFTTPAVYLWFDRRARRRADVAFA